MGRPISRGVTPIAPAISLTARPLLRASTWRTEAASFSRLAARRRTRGSPGPDRAGALAGCVLASTIDITCSTKRAAARRSASSRSRVPTPSHTTAIVQNATPRPIDPSSLIRPVPS